MIEHPYDEQLFQRYLLGDLAEEERDRLQESYFADTRLFSRLLSAEADLIDAYGRGELTEDERKRFERRFGNIPGIDQRVSFASMLSQAADQHLSASAAPGPSLVSASSTGFPWLSSTGPSLGSRVFRASAVAIAALILVMVALAVAYRWLRWSHQEPGYQLASSQTASPTGPVAQPNSSASGSTGIEKTSAAGPPPTKLEERRQPPSPKLQLASVSVVLHEGITRADGQGTEVALSQATRSLLTQLELPSDLQIRTYSRYQAVLQTVSGQEILRRDGLKISRGSDGSFVRVTIPVELLTTRDYVVLLNAQQPDGTLQYLRGYSFSVTRK